MSRLAQPEARARRRCVIRADASIAIGSGHIMRCLTLAEALKELGDEVIFIMRAHRGHRAAMVEARGFRSILLSPPAAGAADIDGPYAHSHWLGLSEEQDAEETLAVLGDRAIDLFIVDHYGLGAPFEAAAREKAAAVMAIDDLADRPHQVELLVDPSLRAKEPASLLYRDLIPAHTRLLEGPDYALLREEFRAMRPRALARRDGSSRRILISMGGVDADDRSSAALRALIPYQPAHVDIVMGSKAPALQKVRSLAQSLPYPALLHVDTAEMSSLMAEADLSIGAAGGTAYERACLGLPSLMIALAENQRANIEGLVQAGAALEIGAEDLEGERLAELIRGLSASRLREMSRAAASLVDGEGAQRIIGAIDALKKVS